MVSVVFGWDRTMLEGSTKESRAWRDTVDTWWADKLNMPNLTPRLMLQLWGTDVCRKHFHDDIWIRSLERKITSFSGQNIVISDARYPNELTMLAGLGAKLICVERGEKPAWYNWAYKYNLTKNDETKTRMRIIASLPEAEPNPVNCRIHTSEWEWIGTDFDIVIDNDGSVDELYDSINKELCFDVLAS